MTVDQRTIRQATWESDGHGTYEADYTVWLEFTDGTKETRRGQSVVDLNKILEQLGPQRNLP